MGIGVHERYGSEAWPIIVSVYHVVEKIGTHRFITINDFALEQMGGEKEFENILASQFHSCELLGSEKVVVTADLSTARFRINPAIKNRMQAICRNNPGTELIMTPWVPEGNG